MKDKTSVRMNVKMREYTSLRTDDEMGDRGRNPAEKTRQKDEKSNPCCPDILTLDTLATSCKTCALVEDKIEIRIGEYDEDHRGENCRGEVSSKRKCLKNRNLRARLR